MGKKNKNKSMGAVPSSYYEMNVDQVALEEDSAPPTDVDGNAVYEETLKYAEELLEQAKNIGVNTIGEELSKSEADLGVIDVASTPEEEEKKDDNLSQKQKQQKGGYNGWWWWRK